MYPDRVTVPHCWIYVVDFSTQQVMFSAGSNAQIDQVIQRFSSLHPDPERQTWILKVISLNSKNAIRKYWLRFKFGLNMIHTVSFTVVCILKKVFKKFTNSMLFWKPQDPYIEWRTFSGDWLISTFGRLLASTNESVLLIYYLWFCRGLRTSDYTLGAFLIYGGIWYIKPTSSRIKMFEVFAYTNHCEICCFLSLDF